MKASEPAERLTGHAPYGWLLAALGLVYLPQCFLGYGSDHDVYLVLRTGQDWWQGLGYRPSRNPGNPAFEWAMGGLSQLGGPLLCNLCSLGFALVTLWALGRLGHRAGLRQVGLGLALIGLHPLFVKSAGTSMDYLWAIGLWALVAERLTAKPKDARSGLATALLAGVLVGLSVGCRMVAVLPAAALLALGPWVGWRRVWIALSLGAVIALFWYSFPWAAAGHSLAFTQVTNKPAWSLFQYVVRFSYRNVYFWGLAGGASLGWAMVSRGKDVFKAGPRRFGWFALASIAGAELFFAWAPFELEYLLPILPVAGLWLAHTLPRSLVLVLIAATFSYGFISLELIEPDMPGRASSGKLRPSLAPGILVRDWHQRQEREQLWRFKEPSVFERSPY